MAKGTAAPQKRELSLQEKRAENGQCNCGLKLLAKNTKYALCVVNGDLGIHCPGCHKVAVCTIGKDGKVDLVGRVIK